MQQPSSNYYLASYGAYLESSFDDDGVILRASYIERPEFKASGFADQDYGWFALAGTKVTETRGHGLKAFFGAGKMEGYLRTDPSGNSTRPTIKRFYGLPGIATALEYAVSFRGLKAGIQHKTFIGYGGPGQTEARVAWPFAFFLLTLGYGI